MVEEEDCGQNPIVLLVVACDSWLGTAGPGRPLILLPVEIFQRFLSEMCELIV
jgi:hypothetical protein